MGLSEEEEPLAREGLRRQAESVEGARPVPDILEGRHQGRSGPGIGLGRVVGPSPAARACERQREGNQRALCDPFSALHVCQ